MHVGVSVFTSVLQKMKTLIFLLWMFADNETVLAHH